MMQSWKIALAAAVMLAGQAEAQLVGTLRGAAVEKGVTGFKFAGFVQDDDRNRLDGTRLLDFEINHGVSDRLQIGLDTFDVRPPGRGRSGQHALFGPSLKYRLWEKGSRPAEAALFLRYVYDMRDNFADVLNPGLLVDSTLLGWKQTSNFYLQQKLGNGVPLQGTLLDLRLNHRYPLHPAFEPGVEFQGNSGPLGTERRQTFQRYFAGPSVYGVVPLGEESGKLTYQVGYLFGVDDETPDTAARWRVEYRVAF